jgi:hypothetical protein
MTVDLSRVKIYIRPGYTDLRKAVNGLTVLVQELKTEEVYMLLAGIDFWKAHKPVYYQKVS